MTTARLRPGGSEVNLHHKEKIQRGVPGDQGPQVAFGDQVHQAQHRAHNCSNEHAAGAPREMNEADEFTKWETLMARR